MKTIYTIVLLTFFSAAVYAQTDTIAVADTAAPKWGWVHNLVSGMTLTQVSFTDWAAGGDNALAYSASVVGKSINDQEMTIWTNSYTFGFGQADLANKGVRKTDDAIDLESVYAYKLSTLVNPYVAVNFKTQFAAGFTYSDTDKTQVSAFMDPGYLREAVGISLNLAKGVTTRFGAALRETFTSSFNNWADDPETPEVEKTKIEGGIEWVSEAELELDSNILFKAKLETFAPFKKFDKWVINNDNVISAKITKVISVMLGVSLRYDEFVLPRTQIKQGLSLGISYQVL